MSNSFSRNEKKSVCIIIIIVDYTKRNQCDYRIEKYFNLPEVQEIIQNDLMSLSIHFSTNIVICYVSLR